MFNLTRGEELTAVLLIALVGAATAVVCLVRGDRGKTVEIPLNTSYEFSVEKRDGTAGAGIAVHIAGEVYRKGVLELPAGSRAWDAVVLAGPTPNAEMDGLNLAAPLVDGERIVVPAKGVRRPASSSSAGTFAVKINVNTASQKELESLPGIGPVFAKRIVELRPYGTVDDLIKVRGIGPSTLEQIRQRVCVK